MALTEKVPTSSFFGGVALNATRARQVQFLKFAE